MKHDALCKTGTDDPYCALCHCELIAAVREDESQRIADLVENLPDFDSSIDYANEIRKSK